MRRASDSIAESSLTGTPGHDVVDLERDADAEKQWQCDDVREVQLQPITTQISSVTTIATSKGTSVNAT